MIVVGGVLCLRTLWPNESGFLLRTWLLAHFTVCTVCTCVVIVIRDEVDSVRALSLILLTRCRVTREIVLLCFHIAHIQRLQFVRLR